MSLILKSERKNINTYLYHISLYLLLIIGAISIIYPFMLMISSSISSEYDYRDYKIFPRYLFNNKDLYFKYLTDAYGDFPDRVEEFKSVYDQKNIYYIRDYKKYPSLDQKNKNLLLMVNEWKEFRKSIPIEFKDQYFLNKLSFGDGNIMFRSYLKKKFKKIKNLNDNLWQEKNYDSFGDVGIEPGFFSGHLFIKSDTKLSRLYDDFKSGLPADKLYVINTEKDFQKYLKKIFKNIELFNKKMGTSYGSFYQIALPVELLKTSKLYPAWKQYLRTTYPLRYMEIKGHKDELLNRFKSSVLMVYRTKENFNRRYAEITGEPAKDHFSALELSYKVPKNAFIAKLWMTFIDQLPETYKIVYTVENEYREYLRAKYKSLSAINKVYAQQYKSFNEIKPPGKELFFLNFLDKKHSIRFSYLFKNYSIVFNYILIHGHAVLNTFILVFLTIIFRLAIVIFTGYALSRFKLKISNHILLFLIATMAFPPEVLMIPNFLLLKNFGLLNTYAALILPRLVQGMGIFLLKGFFDAIPEEIYQAAEIDGASHVRVLFNIALPLAKPMIAVFALQAFVMAYSGFMWAFIICPKKEMWTLMVFLYEFQQTYPQFLSMAALLISGIPTLIMFVITQKFIMKGIVIPSIH